MRGREMEREGEKERENERKMCNKLLYFGVIGFT